MAWNRHCLHYRDKLRNHTYWDFRAPWNLGVCHVNVSLLRLHHLTGNSVNKLQSKNWPCPCSWRQEFKSSWFKGSLSLAVLVSWKLEQETIDRMWYSEALSGKELYACTVDRADRSWKCREHLKSLLCTELLWHYGVADVVWLEDI